MSDNASKDFSDYLKRHVRNHNVSLIEIGRWFIVREVGRSYGLSEEEIDITVKATALAISKCENVTQVGEIENEYLYL